LLSNMQSCQIFQLGTLIQESMNPILGVSVEQFQNNSCSMRGGMFTSWWGCTA
jgi:hypothetical protein